MELLGMMISSANVTLNVVLTVSFFILLCLMMYC
jgi:hypothetical protein